VRGQVTTLSPQVSGYVVAVGVKDFQPVKAGDVLVRIDDRIYAQRVQQAQANLDAAKANLANSLQAGRSKAASVEGQRAQLESSRAQLARTQADMRRVDELVADGSVSLREQDQTRAALLQAQAAVSQSRAAVEISRQDVISTQVSRGNLQAAVESAQAALRLAEIDLSNTLIRAPQDGRLSDVGVRQGQYVSAGSQLLFLVPPQMWVTANYKERQTAHMAAGQRAVLSVDALNGARITGRIERISPASGSEFSVLKSDNATGNFVKAAQRIPVRIALDPEQPDVLRLRAGMSVEARVDTASGDRR
jgi:multidrug resistance efflux pump